MMTRTLLMHPLKILTAVGAALLVWGLVLAYASSPAWAATITVNSAADPGADDAQCTLREAITSANTDTASGGCVLEGSAGADTITFDLPDPSTISLNSEMLIADDLEISGPGASDLTISGNDTSRVFFVNPGAPGATSGPPATGPSVAISNLTIANGLAKGGNGGAPTHAGGSGGAAGMGGAIFVNNGSVTIDGVAFSGNLAQGGNASGASSSSWAPLVAAAWAVTEREVASPSREALVAVAGRWAATAELVVLMERLCQTASPAATVALAVTALAAAAG